MPKPIWPWLVGGGAVLLGACILLGRPRKTIWTIVFENKSQSDILNANLPTFNWIQQNYITLTGYRTSTHPSLPNYIKMTSGQTYGITDDVGHSIAGTDHVFAQLDAAGVKWRSYAESLPRSCPRGDTDLFARRHVPALYYDYVTQDSTYCASRVVDFNQLSGDLQTDTPTYNFITPNIIDDMHDGTIQQGEQWLGPVLQEIMSSDAYRAGGVIFILWDENDSGGTLVPAFIVSEEKRGTIDASFGHIEYLATVQDLLGLPRLTTTSGVFSLADQLR